MTVRVTITTTRPKTLKRSRQCGLIHFQFLIPQRLHKPSTLSAFVPTSHAFTKIHPTGGQYDSPKWNLHDCLPHKRQCLAEDQQDSRMQPWRVHYSSEFATLCDVPFSLQMAESYLSGTALLPTTLISWVIVAAIAYTWGEDR